MEDLIRTSALLISEDEAEEEDISESEDKEEEEIGSIDEEGGDMGMGADSWQLK